MDLPLPLAWSGLRTFDLDDVKLLLGMYRIVLTTGLRDNCIQFLDGNVLTSNWARLQQMVGRGIRLA
ncbi:transcriptional regulator [Streptomyces sp. NPDC017988]|uniref:transcriptional regulator n=1 Tax=Streptomyces sp. NPDC017988 TaxID=3365025 RepID=UPI00379BBB78